MAAVLACGPGAALSHRHAAELLKIGREKGAPIEVSAPRERDHEGILVHRRKALEATHRFGIPVTTVVQTMIEYVALPGPPRQPTQMPRRRPLSLNDRTAPPQAPLHPV